jgi:hypothetical protein
MRDIKQVINDVIAEIPETDAALISDLKKLLRSCSYSAPEMAGHRWTQGSLILGHHIPEPVEDWQKRAVDIWTDKPSAAIRERREGGTQ